MNAVVKVASLRRREHLRIKRATRAMSGGRVLREEGMPVQRP